MSVSIEQARAAKSKVADAYRPLGTVVGVGITKVGDDYAVKVNLRRAMPAAAHPPTSIDGVPVAVEVAGPVVAR